MQKKIVIIDDDRVTLAMLEKVLIMRGFWVYSAKDGAEGYELVKREKPDVLITDMLIPKIHGLDLCKKIKESSELNHIKVILMTAVYKGITLRREAMECMADGFMEKPVDIKDMISRIYKLLNIEEADKETK